MTMIIKMKSSKIASLAKSASAMVRSLISEGYEIRISSDNFVKLQHRTNGHVAIITLTTESLKLTINGKTKVYQH
jgi:hypothetical protein